MEKEILLENIEPNDYNPNEMSVDEFSELVKEVDHLGKPPKPIVLRKKDDGFEIVDGEHSYRALKQLNVQKLHESWYEIVDYDDIEARRQTYKRNLGGKNNSVKLGLMFAQAIEKSGKSNRQLAEEWEVSEGTIRNYLKYAEASKLRNDYANLGQLTNEQIKLYVELASAAQPIADFWLACGAIEDALVWFTDLKFEEILKKDSGFITNLKITFNNILKQGFERILTFKKDSVLLNLSKEEKIKFIQKFKTNIALADRMTKLKIKLIEHFSWAEPENQQQINEYIDLYFNNAEVSKNPDPWVEKLFSTAIIKQNDKLEFVLTIDELKDCMKLYSTEGTRGVVDRAIYLIAKKYNRSPSEVEEGSLGIELELNRLEVEKNAPDYVKEGFPSIRFKAVFLKLPIDDPNLREKYWNLLLSSYRGKEFRKIDLSNEWGVTSRMREIIEESKRDEDRNKHIEDLKQKSEQELVDLFMEKTKSAFKDESYKKEFAVRMVKNFSKQDLYIFAWLANKYFDEKEYQKLVTQGLKLQGVIQK